MTKADKIFRMCGCKTGFQTKAAALYHINMQKEPGAWKTYECPHCYCWHIAHAQSENR